MKLTELFLAELERSAAHPPDTERVPSSRDDWAASKSMPLGRAGRFHAPWIGFIVNQDN
jgi:hypothetical protein